MESRVGPTRKIIWGNIVFFSITSVFALVGCPFYVYRFGISLPEVLLFVFYIAATAMSITAGYHRLFSHVTYRAHPVVQFLFLFFGAAAFEMSALGWSSRHRDHHRYVDTKRDPYNIKKGFFYAHMGWLLFWEHPLDLSNAKDLQKSRLLMHQHEQYCLWAVLSGILTPLVVGFLSGHLLGAFLFSVCLRLTVVYHATWAINSVCHMFGKATYDIHATARDHWLVAFITNGEGYHNFHHRFPSDYRNGVRWYQWDPTKWVIAFMERLRLTRGLRRISDYRILEARLAAEHQRAQLSLEKVLDPSCLVRALEIFKSRYEKLKDGLHHWERASLECQRILRDQVILHSKGMREATLKKMREAREQFKKSYGEWTNLTRRRPLELKQILAADAFA